MIKDDLWPNPLQYFLASDIEVEENGVTDSEDDEHHIIEDDSIVIVGDDDDDEDELGDGLLHFWIFLLSEVWKNY